MLTTATAAFCGPALLHPAPADALRLLLLAPLLEEWVIRAGLQEWLARRTGTAAPPLLLPLLLPAACFGLLHLGGGWSAAAATFWPGLALGLLYRRTRDWRACALVHALMNGCALFFCGLF